MSRSRLVELMSACQIPIWYSPSAKHWWMEPVDALAARAKLLAYDDAIHVTNAYDTLPDDFIKHLAFEAGLR